jgi:hypothetical protein
MRTGGRAIPIVLATVALGALTCAYTWPLLLNVRSLIPDDSNDPLLVTWMLWWSTKAVPLTAAWWNAPAFYPATGVFAFSEHMLGLAPITMPVMAATGSPLAAYNAAFFVSYVASGLGAYFLAFAVCRRHSAALVAAVAYAFAPYRLSHAAHLQLLSSYWMPVALAALHRYLATNHSRWALLFAVAWLMQALSSGYYFFFLSVLVVLWLGWFAAGRMAFRQLAIVGGCWAIAAILMLPLILGYRRIHQQYGMKRSFVEMVNYSADVAGLLSASRASLVWSHVHLVDKFESETFPGLTIPAVLAAGAVAAWRNRRNHSTGRRVSLRRSEILFYSAAAVLMWLLALGPAPTVTGRPIGMPGPYALLMHVPGFDEVRVTARLWMLSVLCLAVVAALVVARIESARLRRFAAAAAMLGILADGWPSAFALSAPPAFLPKPSDTVARLGLPFQETDVKSMYRSIGDDLPVFNGYSGYLAPHYPALRDLLERHDPAILPRLAAFGPVEVTVEHQLDSNGDWRRFVAAAPGARLLMSRTDLSAFEIPRQSVAPPVVLHGLMLPIAQLTASVNQPDINAVKDSDLVTRWHSPEQRGDETVVADLGATRHVSGLLLCQGTYASQYPRNLVVDVSIDGRTWMLAWSGRTAMLTFEGALADPRAVPIGISIERDARFVRLRQTGAEETRGWTIVELLVLG